MYLSITEDDLVSNIQSGFHRAYPQLKLEFYKNPHERGEASSKKERFEDSTPIDDIRMFHSAGLINIGPERIVGELEDEFFSRFGLCVQVLHHSGLLWLETTTSDTVSLQSLNNKAQEMSIPPARQEAGDYNLEEKS